MRSPRLRALAVGAVCSALLVTACSPTDESELIAERGSSTADPAQPPIASPVDPTPPTEAPTPTEPPATEPPVTEPPAAETDALAALPVCQGSVLGVFSLSSINPPQANSGGYVPASAARRIALESSLTSMLAGDGTSALTYATSAEYLLCKGTGAEADLVLWRPPSGSGQAPVALRVGAARGVIIEAPHILFDSGTLEQAVFLFERLKARVLIASGTHRCAHAQSAGCSGTTAACGGGPFRLSDMAHTEESAFHSAHTVLADHFAQDWVLALHGMAASGVSVSDGTELPTTAQSPAAKVATAMATKFAGVTTCNSYPGGVPVHAHMCGTTDVQARHLNKSALACTKAAQSSSQRFIHLEQSKQVRNSMPQVAEALETVLPQIQ